MDQLRRDAHGRARLAHRPLQDVVDAERVADPAQVLVLALECKRRGAPGNLEFLDGGERIEDLLGDAVGEIFLLGIRAHVDEWQDRDRLAACRRDYLRFPLPKAIGDQQHDGNGQHADDDEVQLASRVRRDRLTAIDVPLPLESLRGQFECPGEDQRREKADSEDDEDQSRCPFGEGKQWRDDIDDLQQHPGCDRIGNTDPEYIPALQFIKQAHVRDAPGIRAADLRCAAATGPNVSLAGSSGKTGRMIPRSSCVRRENVTQIGDLA